ncbi:MAG: DUF3604 domain-containing protein [Planctomycetes bacterium]|nr:DUF3604 domain-containing protein [Planctomycetota bacterium]MBI3848354.1 DUF3604 domain-containing protein [Planctomycetota bacterium]
MYRKLICALFIAVPAVAQPVDPISFLQSREALYSMRVGDLHIHTSFSADAYAQIANSDPNTGPTYRNPAYSYAYARDVQGLDFAAVTDHAESLTDDLWMQTQSMADSADDPNGVRGPRFVALKGWEWSSTATFQNGQLTRGYGHRNVICRNNIAPPHAWNSLNAGQSVDTSRPDLLWTALDSYRLVFGSFDYITLPHTSAELRSNGGGDYRSAATDWDYVDGVRQPAVEIYSKHGSCEGADGREWIDTTASSVYDWWVIHTFQPVKGIHRLRDRTVQYTMNRWVTTGNDGYRLGLFGSTDTHTAKGGLVTELPVNDPDFFLYGNGGLIGAWVQSFTREGVFDAIKARRIFATSGPRTAMSVAVVCSDGASGFMGDVVHTSGTPTFAIHAVGVAGVEILRNGVSIAAFRTGPSMPYVTYTDLAYPPGRAYYYVRAQTVPQVQYWTQKVTPTNPSGSYRTRERIWSSPISIVRP